MTTDSVPAMSPAEWLRRAKTGRYACMHDPLHNGVCDSLIYRDWEDEHRAPLPTVTPAELDRLYGIERRAREAMHLSERYPDSPEARRAATTAEWIVTGEPSGT